MDAIKRLFPPGLAWDENPLVETLAQIFSAVTEAFDDDSKALFLERFTLSQKQSLDEWEQAFALQDDCSEFGTSIADRRKNVIARRIALGGQTEQAYRDLAKLFGFEIEIKRYAAFRVGYSQAGDAVGGNPLEITINILDGGLLKI